jgi:hypothetical protein
MSDHQSKTDRIAEVQANLPLPEDLPAASDVRTFITALSLIPGTFSIKSYIPKISKSGFLLSSFWNYS